MIGGGLAGCEAAWALAERGVWVRLVEMRPVVKTPAHQSDALAELVCSNTFKSVETHNAHGLLKAELRLLGSLLLQCADEAAVPGGSALAVDRAEFSRRVTEKIAGHSCIDVIRGEAAELPEAGIVATGPLTSARLSAAIQEALGTSALSFYDAIAPIVSVDSLDTSVLFKASRHGKSSDSRIVGSSDGDYWNSPLSRDQYDAFIAALTEADQHKSHHEFDQSVPYFEGCLPVEEMAERGPETLRYGPLKPVGLTDPRTGHEAYAVVQLRQEDRAGQMWNMVGFQTRLRIPEQQRVFRMIPGLEQAEFLRFGSIHRNAYINSPAALTSYLSLKAAGRGKTLFAGQITGVEGYTESLATGLLAGLNLHRLLTGKAPEIPPPTTMLGGLMRYLNEADPKHFQPMNANHGLLPPLERTSAQADKRTDKRLKKDLYAQRALADMTVFAASVA